MFNLSSKKATLDVTDCNLLYVKTLIDHLNHLGYDFGCGSSIAVPNGNDSYLVSLPDLFYLIDRIEESLGMPRKALNIPEQGVLFSDDVL